MIIKPVTSTQESNPLAPQSLLLVTNDGGVIPTGAGQKRITDRFVKYPYPPVISSSYNKDYAGKKKVMDAQVKVKDTFNLEKEQKKGVKHDLNAKSSHKIDFKAPLLDLSESVGIPEDSLYAAKTSARQREMAGAPVMVKSSLYKNEYLNWGGSKKPLIEKTPQYPYYSLPFRGKSEYKERYKNEEDNNHNNKKSATAKHSKSTPKV
jgi:hypothetical protein